MPTFDRVMLDRYESSAGPLAQIKAAELAAVESIAGHIGRNRSSLLDIGTCTGRYLAWGHAHGFRQTFGMDLSADALEHCRHHRRIPKTLLQGSCAEEATYRGLPKVDLVTVMMGTANHLTTAEFVAMLNNVTGVLAEHGRLVLSTWRRCPRGIGIYSDETAYLIWRAAEAQRGWPERLGFAEIMRMRTEWLSISVYNVNCTSNGQHSLVDRIDSGV